MTKTILVFGVIAGTVIIGSAILSISVGVASVWLGFLVMFIALSAIFVAVKQHRDQELGGVIRFGTAFKLGLGISLVASLVYVVVWEAYLHISDFAFIEQYGQALVQAKIDAGASEAEIAATVEETQTMAEQYNNPWFRLPVTFSEIFPVGFLVSLVSALVLRNSKVLPSD